MFLEPQHLSEVQRILAFWAPGMPVFAYGSRAHGRNLKPLSDLDLCLRDAKPVPDRVRWQLKDAFDLSTLPMPVEIVDWHDISPEFRAAIDRDLVRLQ